MNDTTAPGLLLDVSRLIKRGGRSTPTGIDRVEHAYFSHAMRNISTLRVRFVAFLRLMEGIVPQARADALHALIDEQWRRPDHDRGNTSWRAVKENLERPLDLASTAPFRSEGPQPGRFSSSGFRLNPRDIARAQVRLNRYANAHTPSGQVYLHTSHNGLDKIAIPRWLSDAQVAPVFFLHDVIPIEYPEFCRPGEAERHMARLKTISAHARLVLVNSAATERSARRQLQALGWRVPPFAVVPLGVEECFRNPDALDPPRAAHPYFVVAGTIEPRKNLTFLFAVWRRLVDRHGPRAPRLVLVGRRGWENENVLDYLERSSILGPYIIEASDISDFGLASLIAGAKALLSASLAEGFSLPVAEALSLGQRVIASDIDVHREISAGYASLVDPLDGPGWIEAVEHYMTDEHCAGAGRRGGKSYTPLSWTGHAEQGLSHISAALRSNRRAADLVASSLVA